MNIRDILAALLCALMLGNSHAEPMKVDGEPCLIPDASYVHAGVLNDRDRFIWMWCTTRFDRYWSMVFDPLDRSRDMTFVVGGAKPSDPPFTSYYAVIGWGEPATADLERAARDAVVNDQHRPPIPAWRVQTNGKSATRPGYVISDGKRSSAAATERVPVGVACGCREKAGRTVEGKSVYCVVPGLKTTDLGALCTPGDATAVVPEPPKPPRPPVPPPVLTPPTTSLPPTGGNAPGVRP